MVVFVSFVFLSVSCKKELKFLAVRRVVFQKNMSEFCLFCVAQNTMYFPPNFLPCLRNVLKYQCIFLQIFWNCRHVFLKILKNQAHWCSGAAGTFRQKGDYPCKVGQKNKIPRLPVRSCPASHGSMARTAPAGEPDLLRARTRRKSGSSRVGGWLPRRWLASRSAPRPHLPRRWRACPHPRDSASLRPPLPNSISHG